MSDPERTFLVIGQCGAKEVYRFEAQGPDEMHKCVDFAFQRGAAVVVITEVT